MPRPARHGARVAPVDPMAAAVTALWTAGGGMAADEPFKREDLAT